MYNKYSNLLKDTMIFAIGSLGSKVILFFLVPLYTNFLTTAEYGTADLVSSFASLLIPISSLVINEAVIRFGMKRSEKPANVLCGAYVIFAFSVVFTVMVTPVFGLYKAIAEWKWYLAGFVILSNIAEIQRCYLKVKDNNKAFAAIGIMQTAVLAVSNIITLTIMHTGVNGYLLSQIIALIASSIASFLVGGVYSDLRRASVDWKLIRRMVLFSTPLIFSNVSWWVIHSCDKIMIEVMIGASALGLYTAATKIPSLINVIIAIFNQAWGLSSIREIETTNDRSFYSSVFDTFSVFLFGAAICFVAIIKPFMSVYVGDEFKTSWVFAPLLLSAAVYYSISAFVASIYSALQRTTNIMWTTIICAFINIIINYFGINAFGTWGAILGTVISYFIIAIIRMIDINRYMEFSYNKGSFAGNSILLLTESVCVSLQWQSILVTISVVVVFLVFNRKQLLKITEMVRAKLLRAKLR